MTDSSQNISENQDQLPPIQKRSWVWFILIFALVILGLMGSSRYLVKSILTYEVSEKTNGDYVLDFEELNIKWFDRQIIVSNASFQYVGEQSESVNNTSIKVEKVFIDVDRLVEIYYQKELNITSIQIQNPEIWVNINSKTKSSFSFASGNLYKAVNGVVNRFELKNLDVNHLKLHYTQGVPKNEVTVSDISFHIKNFSLDSNAIRTKEDFFFTESFELKLVNQSFELPNTEDEIHFDSLLISTSKNILEIYNLTLDTAEKQLNNTKVKLQLPYAGFVGVNFLKAYQTNVLEVDSLLFDSPELFGRYLQTSSKNSLKNKILQDSSKSVIAGVLEVFESVELHRFVLDNAQVKGEFLDDLRASIRRLDIDISGFQMDSTDLDSEKYFPRYDSFSVSIDQPDFALHKNIQLEALHLNYNSNAQFLVLDSARIKLQANASEMSTLQDLDVSVSQIALNGISPNEFLTNKVALNKITINDPIGDVVILISEDSITSKTKLDWYSPIVNDLDKSITFNQLLIDKGRFDIYEKGNVSQIGRVSGLNLRLSKVLVDNQMSINHLVSRGKLDLKSFNWNLKHEQHHLAVKKLRFVGYNNWLTVDKLTINPIVSDSSELTFLSSSILEGLDLKAVSLGRMLTRSEIYLSRIALKKALVNHHIILDSSKITHEKITPLKMGDVDINNVNLRITNLKGTVVKLDSLYVNSREIDVYPSTDSSKLDVVADSLAYGAENVFIPLQSIKHMVSVGKVAHQTDTISYVSNLSIRPLLGVKVPDSLMKINAFVPELIFEDNKVFEGKKSDSIEISSIALKEPIIRLRLPKKVSDTVSDVTFSAALPLMNRLDVSHVLIDNFEFNDAQINIATGNSDSNLNVSVGKADLKSSGWDFTKDVLFKDGKVLWADTLKLSLSELSVDIPQLPFCHSLDSVSYYFTPKTNNLCASGLYLNNNLEPNETSVSAFVPQLNILNLQVDELLNNNNLEIDSFLIKEPLLDGVIRADQNTGESGFKSKLQWRMPKEIGGLNSIAVNRVEVQHLQPNLSKEQNNELSVIEIGSINIAADTLELRPNLLMDSANVFWSHNVSMDINDIYTTVDDGLYSLSLGDLKLSTVNKHLELYSIQFAPTVYRYEYALHKGHRKDVFNIKGEMLKIKDFDFFHAVTKNEFKLQSLWLNEVDLNILKDKRIPLPPYKYKAIIPDMFKRLPVTISADTIGVSGMDITYEEFPAEGRAPGVISLTNMDVYANNVTNDTLELIQDSTLGIFMSSKFLNEGDLQLELKYNMLDSLNSFTMHTTLGEMDGTLINAYAIPAYRVEVNSLNLEKMEMNAIGNDTVSGGLMGFFYDDLKFTFLKDNDRGQWLKTTVGNTIIGKNKRYHALRKGRPVYFKRDDSKGWIGYLIRIELSGIESNVGLASYNKDLKAIDKKLWKDYIKEDKRNKKVKVKEAKRKAKEKKKGDKKVK